MKNKIRTIAASTAVMAMALPMLASAAFSVPTGTGLPAGSLMSIITNIMNWLLLMVGVIGVIGFAIAGILYLTAAGDDTAIERAKSAMMYSIIGVIVAIVGVVAITAVQNMLGGSGQNF